MNTETNHGKSCFVYKDNKFCEYYRKKNGNVCLRRTVKTCISRILKRTTLLLSLNMETMITLTKLAMLLLLRYEFLEKRRASKVLLVFLARDVIHLIYISRLCYDVSVRLSVTEVHWRIIANLRFKFRSLFTARNGACGCEGWDHRREEWRDHLALC